MKRKVSKTTKFFFEMVEHYLDIHKLKKEDFEEFIKNICENPEIGEVVPGTGGLRKARLKSVSGGKRGGFRVCYFDSKSREEIFFITIYQKNDKENLSQNDLKIYKELINEIKKS